MFLAILYGYLCGIQTMNWLYDNIRLITFLTIIIIISIIVFGIAATSTSKTPEASDLQGFPGTLGDFPPLPPLSLPKHLQDIPLETLEQIIEGDQNEPGEPI